MKKISTCLLALFLAVLMGLPAYAKTYTSDNWQVTFTADAEMSSNFETEEMDTIIGGMQPGDDVIITLRLSNQNANTTNWYMTNKVLSSLENSRATASGGAYTYRLAYTGPDGVENELFNSDTVGGEDVGAAGEGLNEATSSLKDYFLLDTLGAGQSGIIVLEIGLDGETQGNGYQDTLADLQMNFAVELNEPDRDSTIIRRHRLNVVSTGDLDMLPYIVAAAVSGVLLLVYAIYSLRQMQKRKGR